MRYFDIKKALSKLLFCSTQCICIRRWLRCRKRHTEFFDVPVNMNRHPIFDLESGEL